MRAVVPFVVTVLVVSLLAPFLGLVLFGALTGSPQLAGSRDLAGVPFLLYAARFALPIAVPASIAAAIIATVFSYGFGRQAGFWRWVIVFALLGLGLGVACSAPMVIACIQQEADDMARAWLLLGAVCGAAVMALLSGVWYKFFRVL